MKKNYLFMTLFIVMFVFCGNIFVVNAKSNFNVAIKSISEGNNNGTYASRVSENKDGNNAYFSFLFQRSNDEIYYDVTLENNGSDSGTLRDIKVINDNEEIKAEVSGIEIGDKLEGLQEVKARVTLKLGTNQQNNKNDKVQISFIYEDNDGNLVSASSNPNTFDGIFKYIIIFILSLLVIFILLYKLNIGKGMNNSIKIVCLLVGATLITLTDGVVAKGIEKNINGVVNLYFNISTDYLEVWDGNISDVCFRSGTGSENDPYMIENGEELACFAKSVNEGNTYSGEYIGLKKDIILNENVIDNNTLTSDTSLLNKWTPIGGVEDNDSNLTHFSGVFNGNNHYISGLFINGESQYAGLFGATDSSSIHNLNIVDSYVYGSRCVSVLDAMAENSIHLENIEVDGVVISSLDSEAAGGMVGMIVPATDDIYMKDVKTSGTIDSEATTGTGGVVGFIYGDYSQDINLNHVLNQMEIKASNGGGNAGIIGFVNGVDNVNIISSYNEGNIRGNFSLAGFIGRLYCNDLIIEKSYNKGTISGLGTFTGGLLGDISVDNITVSNSYNTGDVSNNNIYSSGIIAKASLSSDGKLLIDNVYNTGNIKALEGYASGILAGAPDTNAKIQNSYNTGNIEIGESANYAGGIVASANFCENIVIDNCYNKGEVKGYYGIGGIIGMGGTVNISNSYNNGRINYGRDRTSKNIMYVGGILGHADDGVISDCYNTADIYGVEEIGGVAGDFDGHIEKCYNSGLIQATFHMGGILGMGEKVTKSYNKGTIEAAHSHYNFVAQYAGGIGGSVNLVEDCYNIGSITSAAYMTSGISGGGTVKNSYNLSDINIYYKDRTTTSAVSGIVSFGNAYNSYNFGNISIKSTNDVVSGVIFMGGIVSNGSATNCVNKGNLVVSAPTSCVQLGGIIGSGSANESYNTGNVKINYYEQVTDIFSGGISGYMASGDNNYTSGKMDIDSSYNLASTENPLFIGAVFGNVSINGDFSSLNLNNRYVVHDDVCTKYAVGSSRLNLNGTNLDNDINFGKKISNFDVPTILSIINNNDSFKIDTTINNGYPILN